jgi:hypothetical protein
MSNVIITTGRKYALRKMVYKILDEKNTLWTGIRKNNSKSPLGSTSPPWGSVLTRDHWSQCPRIWITLWFLNSPAFTWR